MKADLSRTLNAISLPLLAMLIPILPIFFLIRVVGTSQSVNVIHQVVVGGVTILVLVWYALSLWYLGVVPFLRGTPKLYDLMEDRIRIIFKDGTNITIHFSEIERLRLWDAKSNALRPWLYRLADPFGRLEETAGADVPDLGEGRAREHPSSVLVRGRDRQGGDPLPAEQRGHGKTVLLPVVQHRDAQQTSEPASLRYQGILRPV